jgi:hypothetical protein
MSAYQTKLAYTRARENSMDEFAEFAHPSKHARARGRPTKLDATVQVIICIALHRGATLTAACGEAGVSLKTVCEWLARGRGEDPQRPRTPAYQAFGEAVQRAQDRAVQARFALKRTGARPTSK